MLIFGTNINEVENTKSFLSINFYMKYLGVAYVILGVRITRDGNNISLPQSHYIEKVLKKFGYFDCQSISTPFNQNINLVANKGNLVARIKYSKVIKCLMYAMICTRPDITCCGKIE